MFRPHNKSFICKSYSWKRVILNVVDWIICLLPSMNAIVFESNPDLTCNSYAVFQYFIKHGVNKKYKLIWLVRDVNEKHRCMRNVEYISKFPAKTKDKWKKYVTCIRARLVLSCNIPVQKSKMSKKQLNIYLDHGSPLKKMVKPQEKIKLNCDYYISQADFFTKYILNTYDIEKEKIMCLGVPRNDQLFENNVEMKRIIPNFSEYAKIIVWVPTFRKARNGKRIDSEYSFPLGIPIVYSLNDMKKLNKLLNVYNTLLIIKPHPAQDLTAFSNMDYSNVLFLTNEKMLAERIQTNELLSHADAMITDYSGIYYDYILLDRPIAITLDDYEEYKRKTGFEIDTPLEILKGTYIYKIEDLESFIDNVVAGVDNCLKERQKIKVLTNKYCDNKSTERVCNFIAEKMGWADSFEQDQGFAKT